MFHKQGSPPLWRSVLPHAALALLPVILGLYVPHFIAYGSQATGLVLFDMAYYLAAGREIFERGNGIAYPNPLDTDPNAPAIYFHWLIWLFGFGIKVLQQDPVLVFLGIGLASALILSIITRLIVAEIWPQSRFQTLLFYLVMWGGGLICVAQASVNILKGRDPFLLLFRLDPAHGWWFLNWGRNLAFPTEATYHALVAAAWLASLKKRWSLAAFVTALAAATHPWTGLELLASMSAWWGLRLILIRDRESLKYAAITALTVVCFLAYYFVYLASFPSHARLSESWALDWSLRSRTLLVAYGPVFVLAAARLWRDRKALSHKEGFLVVCCCAAAALALHDRVLPPVQPLHFTRGYIWTPLFLLSLPLLGEGLVWLRRRWSSPAFFATVAVLVTLGVSDNLAFFAREASLPSGQGFTLTVQEREALRSIDKEGLSGVVACEDDSLCYLTSTYTGLTPYHGHPFVSPDGAAHAKQVESWLAGQEEGAWLKQMDYLLLRQDTQPPLMKPNEWRRMFSNDELALWGRVGGP